MAQCIIYARVSTKQQAWGHGIVRQIECCQGRAKKDGAFVRSVYVDVQSGRGPLPQRELAIAEARDTGYPVYVEAIDRFTRNSEDESLADSDLDVVICSELARDFAHKLELLLRADDA